MTEDVDQSRDRAGLMLIDVVETSKEVAGSSGRKKKTEAIARLLRRAGAEMAVVVGFLTGEPRQGRIGVGYASVFGIDVPPAGAPTLTVQTVDQLFASLETTIGPGSVAAREQLLGAVLGAATREEQDFLRRLFVGELRQGALRGVMMDAIAAAADVPASVVRRAAMFSGDVGLVADVAVRSGTSGLMDIRLELLRPILPMLASTSESVSAAVGSMGRASVEWKLDGVRIQVHKSGEQIEVFTRNLNRVTDRVPEVVRVVACFGAEHAILDGEAMSLAVGGLTRPFEETMSRFGADESADAVSLVPFFFDLLHLDGSDLVDEPLEERRRLLGVLAPDHIIPSIITDDEREAERFYQEAADLNHEGVMVKDPASPYAAGRRGKAWQKVKPVHTLDLLILAAEWGHGRRTGWLSNLHLGALDPATGEYVMLGKTFKGLTDEMLEFQTHRLLELEDHRTASTVSVRPGLVVEVAFDGLLPSPRYPGGMALRFARVKAYRHDKGPADVDTIDTVRKIFGRKIVGRP